MRLRNAADRAAYRAAMIPQGAVKDPRSSEAGEAYAYESGGALYAIAFRGSAGKPEWHYRFRDAAGRDRRLAEFFDSIAARQQHKAEQRAKVAAYRHDVKVGDIFRSSWGYDQTNIDYYQVVRLIGEHMAEVREIQQEAEETGFLQGKCVPAPGRWATEADYSDAGKAYHAQHGHYPRRDKSAFRVKIKSGYSAEPCFRVASYANAYRIKPVSEVAGVKVYGASHWTAYA